MVNKLPVSWGRILACCGSVLVLAVLSGCGVGASGEVVDGSLTVGGKSAPFADLTLWSMAEPSPTAVAMTKTDGQGRFEFTAKAKLQAGEYTVTCKRFVLPSGADISSDDKPDEVGAINIVPEAYRSPRKSPLKIRVPAKGIVIDVPEAASASSAVRVRDRVRSCFHSVPLVLVV